MNPEYPGQNPYEFILNPSQAPKPERIGGHKGFIMKIVLIILGVILLMIGLTVVTNILSSSKNKAVDNLKSIPLAQQQVIHITDDAVNTVSDQALKNFSITAKLTIMGQQRSMITYLAQQGVKTTEKQLTAAPSASIDALLKQAKENSTYDTIYTQQIQKQMTAYLSTLNTTYKSVTGPTARKLLKTDYDQTQQLLKMLPAEGATSTPSTDTSTSTQ